MQKIFKVSIPCFRVGFWDTQSHHVKASEDKSLPHVGCKEPTSMET